MKIKSINVLGQKIKVVIKKIDRNYLGLFYADHNLIEISDEAKGDKLVETLVHEIGHAIFKRSGLDQASISHDAQEIICEQFSKVICENFKLTPK